MADRLPPVGRGALQAPVDLVCLEGPGLVKLDLLALTLELLGEFLVEALLRVVDVLEFGYLVLVVLKRLVELYFGLAGLDDLLLHAVDVLPEAIFLAALALLRQARR